MCFYTDKLDFAKEFAFDVSIDFKKLFIKHTFFVKDIIVPKEYENDFLKARLYSKRKGKIIRIIDIDGRTEEREFDFEV